MKTTNSIIRFQADQKKPSDKMPRKLFRLPKEFCFESLKILVRSTNIISQLISSNPLMPSKKTPTIIEENEIETQSIPSSPSLSKHNLSVERLSMSQLDLRSSHNGQSKQNLITNQK